MGLVGFQNKSFVRVRTKRSIDTVVILRAIAILVVKTGLTLASMLATTFIIYAVFMIIILIIYEKEEPFDLAVEFYNQVFGQLTPYIFVGSFYALPFLVGYIAISYINEKF